MTTAPQHVQDAALCSIDAAVTNLLDAFQWVSAAIDFGREHLLDGDEIRGAFERAGIDFAMVLAACEAVA